MDMTGGRLYTLQVMRASSALRRAVVLALVLSGPSVFAREVDRLWSQLYADHLPAYCKYTQQLPNKREGAYGAPESQMYRERFGEPWKDLHHYCFALDLLYQATRSVHDETVRRGMYVDAVDECDYVLERLPDDTCPLIPEIHYTRGIALMTLGRRLEGLESFTKAIEIRPDYAPPYVALSQYFESAGDVGEATRIVREGLTRAPDAPQLRERLAELERPARRR